MEGINLFTAEIMSPIFQYGIVSPTTPITPLPYPQVPTPMPPTTMMPPMAPISKEDQIKLLKQQRDMLKKQLEDLERRLAELETK
ncbi:MAG TPA: hypothetical protein EYP68_01725 [Candidatus Korarchaeota archaeon]|nr:hypothetical protein [Candidatus Korarchaeota archaeon]